MDKTIPFENYLDTSASLYTSSMARFEYVQVEKAVQNYNNAYISLQDAGSNSISLGNAALDYVSDNPLLENLTILESLHQTIPEDLELRNISTLNDDLALYRELIISVGDNALLLLTQYNETRDSKNLANSMVLVLQSKDLEPVSRKMLSLLENESGDLDAKFRGGLTKNELTVLQNNYTVLAREAQELLKSENEMPVAKALLVFREYARKVNNGIASFADASGSFSKKEVPSDSLFLGGFSILLFLSLSSIAFILFLWTISTFKFRIPKTTHILASAFICVVVILFMFSLLMYFFLGKTSTDATLPEFLLDFHSKNSTAIVLDLRNTTYSDSSAMASCALSLADTFSKSNKSWTVYTLTNTACTAKYAGRAESNSTMLVDDCLTYAENATSLFVLDYATNNEPPKFSVIYENKAEIKANLDYYESCPLVALFN